VANLSVEFFRSWTARESMSTLTCAVIWATFSSSRSAFRSAKAFVSESGVPRVMPRTMSWSWFSMRQGHDQSRVYSNMI
jgi:hypothetical protein